MPQIDYKDIYVPQIDSFSLKVLTSDTHLQDLHHLWRKLHEGRVGHLPVYPIHEYPRPDRMRHRAKLRLLVSFPARGRQLAGEG